MSWSKKILKVLSIVLWCCLGGGMLVLLAAAVKKKDRDACKGITVSIAGADDYTFLDKQAVMDLLGFSRRNNPEGKPAASVDLLQLEHRLEKNVWIRDTELFFDNNRTLHVNVSERKPVARIFTQGGSSFYIDSSGRKLPLSDRMNLRLPVFTGFPIETAATEKKKEQLLRDIRKLSSYIGKDKFWMAQIAQIDIVPDYGFEMVPTLGNHVIEFGTAKDYDEKFEKLRVFYKQVLGKTGFDKYSRLNVRYNRQVVATKRGNMPKVDSLQVMKNIQKMIADALAPATEDKLGR